MVPSAAAATTTATATATDHEPMDPNMTTNVSGSITFRLILISFIGILAIWANHEASKGFNITVVNDAGKHSLARKRFSLFYESNDKATQIVLNTSRFVENLLYPNDQEFLNSKKPINHVILRLAPTNIPAMVVVDSNSQEPHEYIISLSPSLLMKTSKNNEAIVLAVLHGMARMWLWDDGKGATPAVLLNGMVEYISSLAGFTVTQVWKSGVHTPENNEICWKDRDPRRVAGFLRYCDQSKQGGGGGGDGEVIRRLNRRMSNNSSWDDWMMDDALGMAGHHACASYDKMMRQLHLSSSM
ncbi:hypothetical protein L6452_25180 [Arctium lappa]|uniref:Uncharacterized protein n=1 Tax=Arctium lappa TaxID=4217 RepID=A0ACB9AF08_ARCLA|nr:hypothetical protein L6452_25180 [Arctium lappa]